MLLVIVEGNGSGKTIGVVRELQSIKARFPECIICTNIDYLGQDLPLTSWLQLLELRNGEKGVVFVIDEVQNQRFRLDKIS